MQRVDASGLPPRLRLLLNVLIRHGDAHIARGVAYVDNIFVSVATLAAEIGLKHRQTQYLLRKLEAHELLIPMSAGNGYSSERNPRGTWTTLYLLSLDTLSAPIQPDSSPSVQRRKSLRPSELSSSVQGCSGVHPMGAVECTLQGAVECTLPSLLPTHLPKEKSALSRAALVVSENDHGKKNGAKVLDELKAEPSSEAHVAIASRAIDAAIADGDESDANVNAHFARLCVEQGLPYNDSIRAEAIDTEVRARLVRRIKALRETSAPTPSPDPRRRHLAGMASHE
jgi:hypothetical protein